MKQSFEMDSDVSNMQRLVGRRAEEYDDILRLLMDNSTVSDGDTGRMARFIALSSLGDNHLWQDMGLADRGELSKIMETWFKPLAVKNTADMKWKKFFYKQICEREGFMLCKSPSCGECVDYGKCFGPEV